VLVYNALCIILSYIQSTHQQHLPLEFVYKIVAIESIYNVRNRKHAKRKGSDLNSDNDEGNLYIFIILVIGHYFDNHGLLVRRNGFFAN